MAEKEEIFFTSLLDFNRMGVSGEGRMGTHLKGSVGRMSRALRSEEAIVATTQVVWWKEWLIDSDQRDASKSLIRR